MIAFKADKNIDTNWILDILKGISARGISSPHSDGWGYAVRGEGRETYNSSGAIFDSDKKLPQSRVGIIHSRKASKGYTVNLEHVHPFYTTVRGRNYAFCHNGTIYDFASDEGTTDTQRYLELLVSNLEIYETKRALEITSVFVAENYRYTSINALLTDYENVWAIRQNAETNDTEHALFLYERDGVRIVSSEPVEKFGDLLGNSIEIKNGESIVL
ncbi:putative glutamine amidotransferase [Mesotoga prima MesG1.Ag.4.2]|uniref:Putative glutamine amidotransferase n=2 Tax=Mesotoga prima TaxID=1184387 RepID=I2F8H7_9BACT|nr:putative glutamine amidotransferase [Mesotoga prima MesG1.Ag.4.2]